jgi:hypothetical protein
MSIGRRVIGIGIVLTLVSALFLGLRRQRVSKLPEPCRAEPGLEEGI